jgi:integrase
MGLGKHRILAPEEVKTVIKAAKAAVRRAPTRSKKNAATSDLMAVLLLECTGGGIREICRLQAEDINLADGTITLRRCRKTRIVPIAKKLSLALGQLIPDSGCIFVNGRAGVRERTMRARLSVLMKKAGVQPITLYSFRRTFAKSVLIAGANVAELRDVLGVNDIERTIAGLRKEQERIKKALERVAGK